MRTRNAIITLMLATMVGCGEPENVSTVDEHDSPATAEANGHPETGPHRGTLIELGGEEYHAELVHDESSVTVYILDSAAKQAVPIESPSLTISALHDDAPEQFLLVAAPQPDDPSGKASKFMLADEELLHALEHHDAQPKLSVEINGKSYRGEIAHEHHDSDSHDHH